MKISVITSTFNAEKEIFLTIENIQNLKANCKVQNLNVEWLVADGNSTDNTVALLENTMVHDVLISEKDQGIYDAWNKIIKYVTGDWIIFLGAGDTIYPDDFFAFISELEKVDFRRTKLAYGRVNFVDAKQKKLKVYGKIRENNWSNGQPETPCHQGVLHHKSIFLELNYRFDTSYRIAGDTKLLFSVLSKYKELVFIDKCISSMQIGGISTDPKNVLLVKKEIERLRSEFKFSMPLLQVLKYNLRCYIKHIIANYLPYKVLSFSSLVWSKITKKDNLY